MYGKYFFAMPCHLRFGLCHCSGPVCDEQMELKADSPGPRSAKEYRSPAFLPHARVVNSLRNNCWLVFICRTEKSLQNRNAPDVQNSKLIGHRVTAALSVSDSQFLEIVADVSDPMTPSHRRFPCLLFVVCVDCDVS